MSLQIVIEVQGGAVRQVYCSDPAAEVFVIHTTESDSDEIHPESVFQIRALPIHELAGCPIEAAIEAACDSEVTEELAAC